jgi:hypothetical protein
MHGGQTPVGGAASQFKTGRYSKYLPARLAGRYEESSKDTELLELRAEVSLVDSRLAELLHRLDTNEAGHWWKELKRVHSEYLEAERKAEIPLMRFWLSEWGRVIDSGLSDYALWEEIQGILEQRRRLVESERKRLIEMQQTITAERAMLLIGALTNIIQSHVRDPRVLAAIAADTRKLITIEPGG